MNECSDENSVSPIVITVKKAGSVKLALKSRELNKQVQKNKYQMPNIEVLMDAVGKTISEQKLGQIVFSTMDLTYAYGKLPLNADISLQCKFLLIGRKTTGTYRFRTVFNGLITMPAKFQRFMDSILLEFPQAHAFIDDIIVVMKGSNVDHFEKNLRKLDKKNTSLKVTKGNFAQKSCEWPGHKTIPTGIKLFVILNSFMGSIYSLHKYLPALAETSAPYLVEK